MIPNDWSPVHRADGEHVGYLAPDGAPGRAHPLLLTGSLAGPAGSQEAGRDLLVARGLAALDRRWWCRLPGTLPRGVLPAGTPAGDWGWRPVVLVEVSPAGCRIRPEWPAPEELTGQASLPVPVGGLLREDPPA